MNLRDDNLFHRRNKLTFHKHFFFKFSKSSPSTLTTRQTKCTNILCPLSSSKLFAWPGTMRSILQHHVNNVTAVANSKNLLLSALSVFKSKRKIRVLSTKVYKAWIDIQWAWTMKKISHIIPTETKQHLVENKPVFKHCAASCIASCKKKKL